MSVLRAIDLLDTQGMESQDIVSVGIWDCVDSNNLRWNVNGRKISTVHNDNIVLDAFGTNNGAQIGQWSHHGGANQQWQMKVAQ